MRTGLDRLEESVLPLVSKPQRYLGELDAQGEDPRPSRVCVLFPGSWEDAMSDPGFLSLRQSLRAGSRSAGGGHAVLVDWSFSPDLDFEKQLRDQELTLFGMDSRIPLSGFDVILAYCRSLLDLPEVLSLCELGGCDAGAGSVLLAAGEATLTPSVCLNHVDGALLGDPEAFAGDILEVLARKKDATSWDRRNCLFYLGEIRGLILSESTGETTAAVPRWLEELPRSLHCTATPILESRLAGVPVELARPRGLHDPAGPPAPCSLANPEEVLAAVESLVAKTGAGRIVLTGPEASRFPGLVKLLESFNRRLASHDVSVDLEEVDPSVFSPAMARELQKGKRSGLTFAPVACSERLRELTGRPLSRDALASAIDTGSRGGWSSIRLRVLVGFPGETPEDHAELLSVVEATRRRGKSANQKPYLSLELVSFKPLPGTRWGSASSADPEAIEALGRKWADDLRKSRIRVKIGNPRQARTEAHLLLGGEPARRLLEHAVGARARRQTHLEQFSPGFWPVSEQTLGSNSLRGDRADAQDMKVSDPAVWEFEPGPAEQPLPALEGFGVPSWNGGRRPKRSGKPRDSLRSDRYRLRYSKTDPLRFVSHLDVTRAFTRAFRSSQIPVAVSNGKDHRQKVSFGPPLPLGMTSGAEYLDMVLSREVPESFVRSLNQSLPEGLAVTTCAPIRTESASLNSAIQIAEYEISFSDTLIHRFLDGIDFDGLKTRLEDAVTRALASDEILVTRVKGEVTKTFNARPSLLGAHVVRDDGGRPALNVRLSLHRPDSVRPELLTAMLLARPEFDERLLRVHRSGLYIPGREKDMDPLDVVASGFQWWQQPVRGGTVL